MNSAPRPSIVLIACLAMALSVPAASRVQNQADGREATVVGGADNVASGNFSTVSGGQVNRAAAIYAVVVGGRNSAAAEAYGTVAGGWRNQANGVHATVVGGRGNEISETGKNAAIAGGSENDVGGLNATVVGGLSNGALADYATIVGGNNNRASAPFATIAGGGQNEIGSAASEPESAPRPGEFGAIGGGQLNEVQGRFATVGGGKGNSASGAYGVVPGGADNAAVGERSLAAGSNAQALHPGSFVWADALPDRAEPFTSQSANEFAVLARGGVRLVTGFDEAGLLGVQLFPGDGAWSSLSDRLLKDHVIPLDHLTILERVRALPITGWSYKGQPPSVRHIGPMAQDFYAMFGLGHSPRYLNSLDVDGVALVSIQALYDLWQEREAKLVQLQRQFDLLQEDVSSLQEVVGHLLQRQDTVAPGG